MKHRIIASIAALLFVAASAAHAEYHTFQIEQIFSNANGTVQFVVMHEMFGQNGENQWMGKLLTSGAQAFMFNSNLPGGMPGMPGQGGLFDKGGPGRGGPGR